MTASITRSFWRRHPVSCLPPCLGTSKFMKPLTTKTRRWMSRYGSLPGNKSFEWNPIAGGRAAGREFDISVSRLEVFKKSCEGDRFEVFRSSHFFCARTKVFHDGRYSYS